MHTPAIVVIGYNRTDSIKRLLGSLAKARYPKDKEVTLIISIDKSDIDDVVKTAEDFEWNHGEKKVIARQERMGLKAHVLACSSLASEYGSVIILEDDLYAAPSFYEYAVKALDFTEECDKDAKSGEEMKIGGVSLYNHLFNVHARRAFTAIDDGYDNWYFQFASSWGQAYTKRQWEAFYKWYEAHSDADLASDKVPANVSGWSEKSWLKYYIAYLIDTDKYFLYPRVSFTTNFGDAGSHAKKKDTDLQVPLAGYTESMYLAFSKLTQSRAVYDAFFENSYLTGRDENVLVDLYGIKPVEALAAKDKTIRYVLTSKRLPYKAVRSYGRQMRPVDANIIYETEGDDYIMYDLSSPAEVLKDNPEALEYLYEYRGISAKQMSRILKYRVDEKILHK